VKEIFKSLALMMETSGLCVFEACESVAKLGPKISSSARRFPWLGESILFLPLREGSTRKRLNQAHAYDVHNWIAVKGKWLGYLVFLVAARQWKGG